MNHTFAALKSRNFRVYFIGYLPSVAGTFMQNAALGWLIYQLTRSNTAVSLVMACLLAPTVLLMPFAGTIADRFNRRSILLTTQTIALGQSLLVLLLNATHTLTPLNGAILCAIAGACLAFEIPARIPLVCKTVEENLIPNALALNSLIFYGGLTIGRALAALGLAAGHINACFAINALSFVVEIVFLAMLTGQWNSRERPPAKTWSEIVEASKHVRNNAAVWPVIVMIAVFGFFGMQFQPLVTGLSSRLSQNTAGVMAIILTAVGFGQIVGSVALARKANKAFIRTHLWLGFALLGVATAALAFADRLCTVVPCALVIGIAIPLCVSGGNAVVQSHTTDEMRGRATGVYFTVFLGSEPLGYLVGGFFADRLGVPVALMIAAMALLGAATWYKLRKV